MTIHSLFFCLRPDPATAQRLAQVSEEVCRRFPVKARPPRTERLHVTLQHLGWFDDTSDDPASGITALETTQQRAQRAAAALRHPPVDLSFDTLLSFMRKPRNRPLVLTGASGLDGVRSLRAGLAVQLELAGLTVDPHFTPHLTLFYDDHAVAPQPWPVPGWTATALHLMDSLQGQSRHVPIAQWPLA